MIDLGKAVRTKTVPAAKKMAYFRYRENQDEKICKTVRAGIGHEDGEDVLTFMLKGINRTPVRLPLDAAFEDFQTEENGGPDET